MADQGVHQDPFTPTVAPATALAGSWCHHLSPPDANHTCQHDTTQHYSDENLPPLLFQLDPPNERSSTLIPNLVENGNEVGDYDGIVIRDFSFLPRYISTRPLAWQLEFWMRLDSRMTYRDIKARMTVEKALLPNDNSLNMRREREARAPLGLSCWTTRRGGVTRTEIERVDKLSLDQVSLNTTMDVVYYDDPVNGHSGVPKCLRARNLTSTPTVCYPWDMFLENQRLHFPGPRLAEALALHEKLLETAAHSNVNDWRELPRDLLPSSWNRRGADNRATDAAAQNNVTRGLAPRSAKGTGRQANLALLGPNDRTNNDNDHTVRTTEFLSRFQTPVFSTEITRNDQAKRTGQTHNPGGFNGYKTLRPIEHGIFQHTPGAVGFPSGFPMPGMGFEFGGIRHGLPAPGVEFGLANYFGHPPNPFVASNPVAYQPRYNPFTPHTSPASTSHDDNPFQKLEKKTGPTGQYQPRPSTPQGVFPDNSRYVLGQSSPRDHMDTGFDASTYSPNPSTPVNQVKVEDEFYRFNGSGPHSIRHNPDHRLNTDTVTVMQRNDPFRRIQEEGSGPFSSFENFLEDQM
ncbi:hypothetical protein ACJ72_02638 [Emergomyces africanus]|uniref:Uncharacterized protein n=1 Tax=Emergomyces africanus TaxID=1955775 RepID=A0A1B7P2D2_9EURO|nr:hypothetical protein ACJ72_02638 [Emergomyces africanus]